MLNQGFYPTPPEVAALMLDPLDLRGKTVFEPSAGSGNLIRECLARGANEVLWCEAEWQLRDMLLAIKQAGPLTAECAGDFLEDIFFHRTGVGRGGVVQRGGECRQEKTEEE